MARLFFKGVPEGPVCSSCGSPNPKYCDIERTEEWFCDEECFKEWYTERSDEFASKYFYDNIYEMD